MGKSEQNKTLWYSKEVPDVVNELNTDQNNGLSNEEAIDRLQKYGPNEIGAGKKISPLKLLFDQFANFLVILLLVSTIISFAIGEIPDGIAIFTIVLFAVILGFTQEYKAEKDIEALQKMAAPATLVIREGEEKEIPASHLIPGDIVILQVGDKVPADARIIEAANLKTNEGSLTGESTPIEKKTSSLEEDTDIGDRINMVFMGTAVVNGRGKAVVTTTGMETEFGKIGAMLQSVEARQTPLQVTLDKVGKKIAFGATLVALILIATGLIRGYGIVDMFLWGVSVIVAIVPEALPAVVTISLAVGVSRMIEKNALIRKLHAVETLGCTDYICSDKTGTLTENQMTIRRIYLDGKFIDVKGGGYNPEGEFILDDKSIDPVNNLSLEKLVEIGSLCNDSALIHDEEGWSVTGDPTEGAFVVLAKKAGYDKKELESKYPRVDEIPFDSDRKMMTTIHNFNNSKLAYSKGGAEVILNKCKYIYGNGKSKILDEKLKEDILKVAYDMASSALRVLGVAYKDLDSNQKIDQSVENDFTFVGLVGMIDPPRSDVKDAIAKCKHAGIKPVMITGDHKVTAIAIAKELGILKDGIAIEGSKLDKMDDEEFNSLVEKIEVYARVSPAHKLRVVDALTKKDHVAAMTGDGVNDAPALKKADIGVAMGITGTDVSKEAADMVLTDDNFTSIVSAVEEGRNIFENIKKFLVYLLAGNLGLVVFLSVVMLFGGFLGLPLDEVPLVAIQILFINLICDGFIAVSLSTGEPKDPTMMDKSPRSREESVFSLPIVRNISFAGFWTGLMAILIYTWSIKSGESALYAQCSVFVSLLFLRFFHALNCRSIDESLIKVGPFKNKWLLIVLACTTLLTLAIVYLSPFHGVFNTTSLDAFDWLMILFTSSTIIPAMEVYKYVFRSKKEVSGNL